MGLLFPFPTEAEKKFVSHPLTRDCPGKIPISSHHIVPVISRGVRGQTRLLFIMNY